MELTDAERLTRLETKLDGIEAAIVKMDAKLDVYSANFVPRHEINEMFRSRDKQLEDVRTALRDNKKAWPSWIAVVTSATAFLYTLWRK